MTIRLLVADDHPLARAGIVTMLSGTEIEISCQARDCGETVLYALNCKPDVVLTDLQMPDGNGLDALKEIKQRRPETPVVVFSAHDGLHEMARARLLGADGYIPKGVDREVLLAAIRRVAAGKSAWTRAQLRRICHADGSMQWSAGDPPLTPRETDVLRKIGEGQVNEDIGEELGIQLETVKQHVKNILKKLGVKDRTEAALWAVRKGLL